MNRLFCIKKLVTKNNFRTYLEIGVFLGKVFFFVPASKKIAVDPQFRFGLYRKFKRIFRNVNNLWAKFYEKTSDDFFLQDAPKIFKESKIDICLIDGMHEYEYALRDIENALRFLQKGGVIIVHDCNPPTKEANISYVEWEKKNFTGYWNGDVWRAIIHLRSLRDDVNVFVLDCDHGLGFVTFGKPENKLNLSLKEIKAASYEQFEQNRKEWLNLKHPYYFFDYFKIEKTGSGVTINSVLDDIK
jgi:SAM-dependent methyltransferase